MAKRKRKATKAAPVEPEVDPFSGSAPDAGADDENAAKAADVKTSASFFKSLGDGLKAAGQTAEKYARLGVSVAELEKLRMELKLAHARLGEAIIRCWDAAPDIGVAPDDPAIKDPIKAVKDLRRRIRELEIKMKTIQSK
ncbi:MAG TPA: hypothetical protein VEK08_12310 [Planctomycetota bacterium]|nr:hypothetical protein [Planctomycetota bacterium]